MKYETRVCRKSQPFPSEQFTNQGGAVVLVLVSLILFSLLIAISLSNWISAQRQGGMRMQVAIKETMLAQSAFSETKFRLLSDPNLRGCLGAPNNTFTYSIDRTSITVTVDCVPFP